MLDDYWKGILRERERDMQEDNYRDSDIDDQQKY